MTDRVRKQLQDITLGIEDDVVDLPLDLVAEAEEETQFALIGKPLNPRKQKIRGMMSALPRLWGVADKIAGRVLENNKVQFLFKFGDQTAVFKIRYEKLRGFCNICGLMSHDSTDCPQNNPNDEEAPHDDNNDDDNADDGPPSGFSTPEHHDPVDPVIPPSDNQHDVANHDSTPSKKRKTEPSVPMVELYPLCYETRQGMIYEEVTEQVLKRMRRQAETCEGRQWFQAMHDQEASSSRASPQGPHKTNDREGTVGHKPPASG
ncbi:uncharacterized protein LOC106383911 [Brassica napus]|uniref:uncharacterized protein LOC106383911 n=1 Tax=Brassica napus TaxID=3708 RepID=UPI0006AB4E8F|nr:uncharacterized protein LOC106383911 [Brassica napus]